MNTQQLPVIPFNQLPKAIHQQQSEIFKIDIEIQHIELLQLSFEQAIDYELAFSKPELKNDSQRKAYRERALIEDVDYIERQHTLRSLKASKKLAENYLGYLLRCFEVGKRDLSGNL